MRADARPAGRRPFPGDGDRVPWHDRRLGEGRVTWTGVAGWRFDLADRRVAFDPFVTRPGVLRVLLGRPAPSRRRVAAHFPDLDAVFVGHAHYDHAMDLPAVAATSPRAVIHGGAVVVRLCRRLGVPSARLVEVKDGGRYAFGPFTVEAVASAHGRVPLVGPFDRVDLPSHGVPRTPFGYPRGEVFAWRLEAAGRSFFLQGSAGIDAAPLDRQAPVDALIACLAARRGTRAYLRRLGERLRPDLLVPCHHDDFFRPLSAPPRPVPRLDWPRFLEDARHLEATHRTRLWVPPRGVAARW